MVQDIYFSKMEYYDLLTMLNIGYKRKHSFKRELFSHTIKMYAFRGTWYRYFKY